MMVTVAVMAATPVWAVTDYSSMSNEELSKIRGTLRSASQEDRNAFRSEWQQRIQAMTPEEQQLYMGRPADAAADGSGMQQGMGRGRGMGRRSQ